MGSATSSEHDQELDSLLVGPIPIGVNKFVFEAEPPDVTKIPSSDLVGVTVLLLTCSYDDREFVRVGYYQNTHYKSEDLQNDPPAKPIIDDLERNILAEKPRVTRFAIKWSVAIYAQKNKTLTEIAGIRKTQPPLSIRQISPKPTPSMTMGLTMALRRRRCRKPWKRS